MIAFTGPLQLWTGSGRNFHFITIPASRSGEIRAHSMLLRRGFGSVKVEATVEGFTWRTSAFPLKSGTGYFLPVKMEVLRHTGISVGNQVVVSLELR